MSNIRNIELPENLFVNMGNAKINREPEMSFKDDLPLLNELKPIEEVKYNKLSNKSEYRDRINRMYDDMEELTPIDSEIDDVLYVNNYDEKGIVIKPTTANLKQFWTEYRLISNEKKDENIATPIKPVVHGQKLDLDKTDEFDTLFDALTKRIQEINDYIEELKEMRNTYNKNNSRLQEEKDKLEKEKEKFNSYKQSEEQKINEEKTNLKVNFSKLQTIIDDLNMKMEDLDK